MSIFTKSLFVPSTIALSLLAVIGTAQAQQTRKIDVISGKQQAFAAAQPAADVNAQVDARAENDAPPADVTDASQAGVDPQDANAQSETAPSMSGPSPQRTETKTWISDEAKRLNRQRYIERYQAAQYEEPRYEQRYTQPRYEERYVQPRYVEHRYAEQRYVAPRYHAPREAYAQNYKAAPSYGHVRRTAEHCAPRGY